MENIISYPKKPKALVNFDNLLVPSVYKTINSED